MRSGAADLYSLVPLRRRPLLLHVLTADGAKRGVDVEVGFPLGLHLVLGGQPFSRRTRLGEVFSEPRALIEVVACLGVLTARRFHSGRALHGRTLGTLLARFSATANRRERRVDLLVLA